MSTAFFEDRVVGDNVEKCGADHAQRRGAAYSAGWPKFLLPPVGMESVTMPGMVAAAARQMSEISERMQLMWPSPFKCVHRKGSNAVNSRFQPEQLGQIVRRVNTLSGSAYPMAAADRPTCERVRSRNTPPDFRLSDIIIQLYSKCLPCTSAFLLFSAAQRKFPVFPVSVLTFRMGCATFLLTRW